MRRIALFFVPALLAAACSSGGGGAAPTASPTQQGPRPASTGKIAIVEPQNNAVITGDSMRVRVQVVGARILADGAKTDVEPNEGHVHVALDGQTLTLLAGAEYVVDLSAVKPGKHLIQVEFAAGDHGPFNPRVVDAVTVTIT